jgi:choline dehydrogenase-like flavoprotein
MLQNAESASLLGVPELRPFYDVIVVGAGSAGAVVAQTLAEAMPNQSILLIESGPNLDTTAPVTREPANSANLFVAQSDGRRLQPPQAFTRTSVLRPSEAKAPTQLDLLAPNYLQGRGWGGSGAINGLVCTPGQPADYNRWAHDYGCTGWSWADISPTIRSLHSQLFLTTSSMYQSADRALLAAYTSLASDQLHLKPAALSILDGRRNLLGVFDSHPDNLHVAYGMSVVSILTESTTIRGIKLADGTELETNHVVLSAGSIGSPVLLQRSGIGGPGVGQNLHDHSSVSVTLRHLDLAPEEELAHRATSQESTPTNVTVESSANIQILPVSQLPADPTLSVWMASPFQAINGRGTVTALPDGTTDLQFDSFSDERDRNHLRHAARLLGQLLGQLETPSTPLTPSSASTESTESTPYNPDAIAKPVDLHLAKRLLTITDDELDVWVLNNQGSYFHAAGTCRMGNVTDPRAVVDPICAVIGWSNISVIDASIFPDLPTANPYLPTVAIAKLAAARLAARLRT